MKPTPTSATPAMKIINGKKCVRVLDLAKAWGTSTATILATDKPHAVPAKYIHRIDGRAWCQLDGLRKRADAVKDRKSSYISRQILDFLDSLEKPTEPKPEPQATDLGTAALIADARRTASQALNRACVLDNRVKALEHDVPQLLHAMCPKERVQELSGKLDRLADAVHGTQGKTTDNAADAYAAKQTASKALDTATQAADLAQENADMITVTGDRISLRLDRLSEHVDCVEQNVIADAVQRTRLAERQQGDTAARIASLADRIATLEEHARAVDWTLAAVAVLAVVGRLIRLLRRR